MMKKVFLGVVVISCCLSAANAASFELLSSKATVAVGASKTRTDRWVTANRAPADFTSYDGVTGRERYGIASQSTNISANEGLITSIASTDLSAGYSGRVSSFLDVSFEVFDATSYSFDTLDFTRFSSGFSKISLSGAGGVAYAQNFGSIGDSTTGQASGVLQAGVYSLTAEAISGANGVNPASTIARFSNHQIGLSLGGAAGVPEATEAVCFLAGTVMFLFTGTRRRPRRRLS